MKQQYKHSSSSFSISVAEIKNQNLKAKIHKFGLIYDKKFDHESKHTHFVLTKENRDLESLLEKAKIESKKRIQY